MAIKRVRIADTEAIAQYFPRYKENVHIVKIVTRPHGKFGRRKISLHREAIEALEEMITQELKELEERCKPKMIDQKTEQKTSLMAF